LSRKINSIDEATKMIGAEQLKTLVIASAITGAAPQLASFDIKAFWSMSFRCAVYAKWLAEQSGYDGSVAYTAGLLSHFGDILLQIALPKEANEIEQHSKAGNLSRAEIEFNRLGFTSHQACAELCRRWKLGNELTGAIEAAPNPWQHQPPSKLACLIHLADLLTNGKTREQDITLLCEAIPESVVQCCGLDKADLATQLPELFSRETSMEFD
jgi:HD-like signal output (HDOD) protein